MKPHRTNLLRLSTSVIVLSLALGLALPIQSPARAQGTGPVPGDLTAPEKGRLLKELQAAVTTAGLPSTAGTESKLTKLSTNLQQFILARVNGANDAAAAAASGIRTPAEQGILVDIYAAGPLGEARAELESVGMLVIATSPAFGGIVEGYLPGNALLGAANLEGTRAIMDVPAPLKATGSALTEGDAAHHGVEARSLGTNGAGVVVGVISDSIDKVGTKISGSQADGDLPATVNVLSDCALFSTCTDEGRAMAEIIYDVAPGITTMYFSSGWQGAVAKASGINDLVSDGVDVIADDITYLNEPFFQDGVVEQAVDAAYASGVAYFAAAGNYGVQSYESNFRDSGDGDHDFDAGGGLNELQEVTAVDDGDTFSLTLQWDDPWGSATHDFDIYLLNVDALTELASGTDYNTGLLGTGLPQERLSWTNHTGAAVTVGLYIHRYAGTGASFLKWIAYGPGGSWSVQDASATNSSTIAQDAQSARHSMAVAAVDAYYSTPDVAESYSSRGPYATKLFNTSGVRLTTAEQRLKPEIAGADCVSTSLNFEGGNYFGWPDSSSFCGTSAAAPHLAGVAALILSIRPNIAPEQLYAIVKNPHNTVDCLVAGNPDAVCGYGFVMADKSVGWAKRNLKADFNGDSATDQSIFRPSNGTWYVKGQYNAQWGATGDIPVAGDYNDDGSIDVAVFRPSNNIWYVKGQFNSAWGSAGDIPVPGDYNGDGATDVAVFRPSNGTWYVKGQFNTTWGITGDIPVPADYNGDGKTELAVFRPSTGVWYLKGVSNNAWGASGDIPVPGDYNGDRKADVAVFRPTTGIWYVKGQLNSAWGSAGDTPVPGDYNGDGKTDVAIFRPSTGMWYVKGQANSGWGQSGDWPIPALWTGQATTSSMYFVLTWGANPRDLDSHLWLPAANPYHIYYGNKGNGTAFPYATLDLDDQDGNGPETIAIQQFYTGTYRYAVYLFAGTGTLATSGAQVQVYRNGALVQTITVPGGSGTWWYVCDVDGGTGAITVQNYITTVTPAPYSPEYAGPEEWPPK